MTCSGTKAHLRQGYGGQALLCALVIAALGLFTAIAQGQSGQGGGSSRQLVHDTGLAPIDVGLRDHDAPRDARTAADTHRVRADRTGDVLPFLRGSVIVKFKAGTSSGAVSSATSQVAGVMAAGRSGWAVFDIVDIPMDSDVEAAAATLRARPDVEYAQPRYLNHAMARPNDPLYTNQWNFPAIDMERAWDIQPGATSDIIVAVLDSGVAFRTTTLRYNSRFPFRITEGGPLYPALGTVDVPFAAAPELGASGSTRFVLPRDFIWDDDLPVDLDSHGTHVTGTIGQLTNNGVGGAGMAYNVRIMPVKIIQGVWDDVFDSPFAGTDDVVARGIRYAADNGAKVINLSIGRSVGGAATVVTEAMRYAIGRGVFIAVASGNTRDSGNRPNRLGDDAATIDGMMVVGAVGRTLDAAYYSTTSANVEIAAPGGDQRAGGGTAGILQQTINLDLLETFERPVSQFGPPRADAFGFYYFQGTSMAVPHVSGFAALLMQQGITSPAAIEAAIKQFATDKGAAGRDDTFGYGLINPRATLRGLGLAK
ncbi:MAG: S8 family serine peptidase [Acidobacteriota bacterium]|nr:S8 family serine peptidase [Acidobacteriota bacterium]